MNRVLFIICFLFLAACQTSSFPVNSIKKKPFLFANYYSWYRTGGYKQWPWSGWTREEAKKNIFALGARNQGEPPLSSAAYPLIGLYDSSDEEVAEWHVKLAQAAGIDAFLVDWWGGFKGRNKNIESGIVTAAQRRNFKIAFFDERAQYHNDWNWYKNSVVEVLSKYKDKDFYLRISGKPLYYIYQVASNPALTPEKFHELKMYVENKVGPVYWIVDKIAHNHSAQKSGDLDRIKYIPEQWLGLKDVDAFGFYSTFSNFRAFKYEDLIGKFSYLVSLSHDSEKKMLLPVHPGYNNSHFKKNPYIIPRRDGQTLKDYLRAATNAGADFIMITSWNEWPETTAIEPSITWKDPYLYLQIVAQWKGRDFIIPSMSSRLKSLCKRTINNQIKSNHISKSINLKTIQKYCP